MHLHLYLTDRASATFTLFRQGQVYHLQVTVAGQRPITHGRPADLLLHPEGGGLLTLHAVRPISGDRTGEPRWCAAFGLRHEQLLLIAIYPMARLTLAPWTGNAGTGLSDGPARQGLMVLARHALGLTAP